MTRILLAAAALGALALAAAAQDDLQAKLDEKLSKEFVKKTPWVLDYDEAMQKAKESNKLIFAYFTRSYAP